MIGDFITAFFNFILDCVLSIVRIVCLPLNAAFNNVFPDFTTIIESINNVFDFISGIISWSFSFIPPNVKLVILLIYTIQLSTILLFRSTHLTAKAWKIFQKIKFW